MKVLIAFAWPVLLFAQFAFAEDQFQSEPVRDQKWNFHFQTTVISQEHGEFPAKYSAPAPATGSSTSLSNSVDNQSSLTLTIFAGRRLWQGAEFYVNPELSGGSGFNGTKGIAGFPNGEIYRVDDPSPKWSLARLFIKQTFELGGEFVGLKDDKNQLAGSMKEEHVSVVVGRFSLSDYFDNLSVAHDPRTQFMNWSLMDLGTWDYAADTRGYSWGFYVELVERLWTLRYANVMIPLQANQMDFDREYPTASGNNLEFEYRYLVGEQKGAVHLIGWHNRANMGNYRNTINQSLRNTSGQLDVTLSRQMSEKYGLGLEFEQSLTSELNLFSRLGWDDGKTETWNFTEIDQTASLGASLKGTKWNRANDTVGLAAVINGLSQDHRDYLANGGYGFMLGDGTLNYAPEEIAELYYLYKVIPGFDFTGDFQYVQNPAYNSDRGPVSIVSCRVHYEM